MRPHHFQKVEYKNKHPEINFFKSLGRFQVYKLKHQWYTDEKGNLSNCAETISDSSKWHQQYWDNFQKASTTKLDDWSFENEYRLVINNMLHEYEIKENRKLCYDFNDLEAIIFGIKTLKSDKLKIMQIVENKCKLNKRDDFNFYQAYYDKDSGKIDYKKLDLLSFDKT